MIQPSANQANSNPEPQAVRAAGASVAAPATGLDKDLPRQGQGDAQDQALTGRSDINQRLSETFFVNGASLTAHGVRSEATFQAEAAKPMSPAAVIGEISRGLERIQQHGDDRVDLKLSLEGGGEVSIQLQMRDGAVHASFQTSSPELREALQQGWSQLAAHNEASGLQLAPPVFKSPETGSFTAGQQDSRERRQEPPPEQPQRSNPFYPAPNSPKRPGQPAAPVRRTSSGLNAWA